MGTYYVDTSALVKRYALEKGTGWIEKLTTPDGGHDVYTVILTAAELVAALYRKVRTGEISSAEALRAENVFKLEWETHFQIVNVCHGPS